MKFKDKTVIVTGASSGIGREIAICFGLEGANVIVHYNQGENAAKEVVDIIKESGGKAIAVGADISDYEAAQNLAIKAVEHFGRIDILVNNAGITKDQLMLRMSEDDFDRVIATNLKGTWNMIKHVSRGMLKQTDGKIINITSIVGVIGNKAQANYAASKAGIIGMTKALSKEFGKKNVTVNAVAPGFIETKMTEHIPIEIKEAYLSQIPLGRLGSVKDVASAVLFLASEDASYITGTVLHVNGGMIG